MLKLHFTNLLIKRALSLCSGLLAVCVTHAVFAAPAQSPLYLTQSASPVITLVMSMDQELFKKAYNDYSNLSGGPLRAVDTTYRNDFKYYGYYDSGWCYTYNSTNGYFTPSVTTANYQCSNAWSGNFLNWATMSRIDIVRQVLYGGMRSTDTGSQTILERAYLPRDIHAFVKVYTGNDVNKYTPYSYSSGISLCNVSSDDDPASDVPYIRVAEGAWHQWSASENTQCQSASSGSISPRNDDITTLTARVSVCETGKDYLSSRCKRYGTSSYKPVGLLQNRGETGKFKFALVSGTFKASLQGGMLRKPASLFAGNSNSTLDEVNLTNGTFNSNVKGIVTTVNAMRINGYNYAAETGYDWDRNRFNRSSKYTDCDTYGIDTATVKGQGTVGRKCRDWGNPLSEIYLEALRYVSGKTVPTSAFNVDDSESETITVEFKQKGKTTQTATITIPGLDMPAKISEWTDPIPSDEWCADCAIIVLSTGTNSFDGDNLNVADLPGLEGASAVDGYTDAVGNIEFGDNFATGSYFAGSATEGDQQCKARQFGGLSDIRGVCPELPALEGSYAIAGLAYYAKTQDLRTGDAYPGKQTITTYAVDLAESLPTFSIPVGDGAINFLPACESKPADADESEYLGCSLTNVRVETQFNEFDSDGKQTAGSYLFYWEDSLWGNDYDLDGVQRIHYKLNTDGGVTITSSVPYAQAGFALRFSYNVSGSNGNDGIVSDWSFRKGNMNYTSPLSATTLTDAYKMPSNLSDESDWAKTIVSKNFAPGSSSAILLKKPLYYAAKFGGFSDSNNNGRPDLASEWDGDSNGVPDNYFSVSNPAQLEENLNLVLDSIVNQLTSASSAAVSSTRLEEGEFVYQARFNSAKWSGELAAYRIADNGAIENEGVTDAGDAIPFLSTDTTMPTDETGMNIYTAGEGVDPGDQVVRFDWNNLTRSQQFALAGVVDTGADLTTTQTTAAQGRLAWIQGDDQGEGTVFRNRGAGAARRLLGDIVNSSPVYDGGRDMRYNYLPNDLGGSSYATYLTAKKKKKPRIFVGSNDGMLHAFEANTLNYLFSYVPNGVYSKLPKLTQSNYGSETNPHQYLFDGQITIGDAFIGGEWRAVLVAALGAGGKSIFGLDITDNVPKLLFEFSSHESEAQDLTTKKVMPSIGYILGKPFIVPLKNNRFAAVFNNGYESGNNTEAAESSLLVVDLDDPDGTHTKVIKTGGGTGLSAAELLSNGIGQIEYAYAGDLSGNLWKFDLTGTTENSWTSSLMFQARDDGNSVQPISAAPTLGRNALKNNKITVYFGTGKYYETTDSQSNASPRHSLYAIVDSGITVDRDDLHEKSITSARVVEDDRFTWTDTIHGWYLDFDQTNGERITVKPLLLYDRLIFPTLIPNPAACGYGGSSWLMQVTAVGDKYTSNNLLDENIKSDYLVLGDLSFGVIANPPKDDGDPDNGDEGESSCPPGTKPASIIVSASDGTVTSKEACLPEGALGRMNWRQLN